MRASKTWLRALAALALFAGALSFVGVVQAWHWKSAPAGAWAYGHWGSCAAPNNSPCSALTQRDDDIWDSLVSGNAMVVGWPNTPECPGFQVRVKVDCVETGESSWSGFGGTSYKYCNDVYDEVERFRCQTRMQVD